MPQPVKEWFSGMNFSAESMSQRPDLSVRIARISSVWANIEVEIGLLLSVILHTEADIGVAMYTALTGSAAQEHVLRGAAEARLSKELKEELESLLLKLRARARERNVIIHGMWSIHPMDQDALINCPPGHFINDLAKSYAWTLRFNQSPDIGKELVASLRSYKADCFIDIERRMGAASNEIKTFIEKVAHYQERRLALAAALGTAVGMAGAKAPQDKPRNTPLALSEPEE